eukprot:GEMP01006898.1.p1 GENE.GEMP01006898.1~~GEMP01006898.1.p1  ORF type:complete len:343 (-),score=68.63 GEMP01006898.1:2540-3568(-)
MGTFSQAFKFLAPDVLSSAILGVKGAGIQEIQQTTNTKISIGDRNDKYPGTNSRLVLIRGEDAQSIDGALVCVIEKLKSLIEGPIKPDVDMSEIISKQGADIRLRVVIPQVIGGALIGPKGAKIADLRTQTGCRVRVEDGKIGVGETAEQMVSLLGSLESLRVCVVHINKLVQASARDPWFTNWAHLNINSKMHAYGGFYDGTSLRGFGYPDDDGVLRIMRCMPRHLVDSRTFAMQTSLPVDAMSGLIGKGGCGTKEITTQTGAKVTLREDEPNTTVTIEGSLNSVLCAYMLVMKRYLELEQQTTSKGKGVGGVGGSKEQKVEKLKQRMAEMQAEVHRLEGI